MASSPSSMTGRRNRPGCMGSIAHLFDFNQALAGRKLLTDKKFGTGLERAASIGGNGRGEASKSQIDSQRARNAVMTKRINEVPIKALIAEEMSKEPDTKNRTPSVVARLMGLDMMPSDAKNEQRAQKSPGVENVLQAPGKSQTGTKYARAPPSRSMSDLSTVSKRSSSGNSLFGLDSRSHFPEQQDYTGTEFERWQNWKSESSSQLRALDDLDSHLAAKQLLIKRKLMEAKLGLSPKHSDRQDKLYESKEFMDAIDFLQANKDFFVRFLEQPDPISRRTDFDVSWSETEHLKNSKSTAKLQTRVKESLRSSETDLGVQRKVNASPYSPTEKNQFDSRISNIICKAKSNAEQQQTPTRIVVLKPGPGKVRNVTPLSHNSPRSSKDFFDEMEVIKENSMDVLQDLRERLQMEDRESLRRTRSCKLPRDPKEIAREIARQVRENVTRDLMANSRSSVSGSHVGFRGRKQYNQFDSEAEGIPNIEKHSQSAKISSANRAANKDLNRVLSRLKVPESGNLGRHSVDVTDLLKNCAEVSNTESSLSQAQFVDRVYNDVHRSLLRSRSVPTSAGSALNSCTEDSRMQLDESFPVSMDNLVGDVGISDTTVHDVDKSKRAALSKRGSGMRNSFSRNRKKKGNRQTDKEDVSQDIAGDDRLESEKIQCQIDDTGPVLDSDSSASSLENFLSLETAVTAKDASASVNPSTGVSATEENESQHSQRCEEPVEDANTSSCSSSTSPRVAVDGAGTAAEDRNTKESSEQPSPVSVLDASFHEESSSPMNFNDISSGLQELRSRLQLLRFVDQETMSCQDDEEYFADENPSSSAPLYLDMSELKVADKDSLLGFDFLLDGVHCPKGKEAEFLYVTNLLVASGFHGDNSAIMTRWHSPSQPLALSIFDDMEKKYNAGEVKLASYTCRLLFDTVNEVLLDILGPHVNCRRCWQDPCRSSISVMPTGKLLMEQLWSGVSKLYYSQADGQDTLGNLVAKDLGGKDRWCNFDCEFEFVMLEVERSIFNDLIQETLMVI